MADEHTNGPWTRRHDDPRQVLLPSVPKVVFAQSLIDLLERCYTASADARIRACGSHWALSDAAISNHTFIEMHAPGNGHRALDRTLHQSGPPMSAR